MTFREFVVDQISRLDALPREFNMTFSEAYQRELRDWLERKAGMDPAAAKRTWMEDSAAGRVRAVINAAIEEGALPTLPQLGAIWLRLYPERAWVTCANCRALDGWVIVQRGGREGAERCTHGVAA